MAEQSPNARSLANQVSDLAQEVQHETAQRKRVSAERAERAAAQNAWFSRERGVLVALIIAVPVLGILVATTIFGQSLEELFTSNPPPAVAHQKAQEAMDALVKGIESFRKDTSELPSSLTEVGAPSKGEWTYTKSGGQYRVVGKMYGEVVTFNSPSTRGPS